MDNLYFDATQFEAKKLGARWDPTQRQWRLPGAKFHAHQLIDARLADASLLDALKPAEATFDDARLYRAQVDAIRRLVAAEHGALVVLPPGYGKTAVSVIAAAEIMYEDIVLVAPAPLQKTWEREIVKWGGNLDHWEITTWDKFKKGTWKSRELLIADESVMAKNRRSQRFNAMKKVRREFGRVWLLSGSPTTKYADDLWTQMNLIWPVAFPSYWRWAERYCVIEDTPWARKVVGDRRDRSAAEENDDLIITVSETIDLPEYLFESVDVALRPKQQRAYDQMLHDFIAELGDGSEVVANNEVAKLIRLQQITSYFDGQSAKHDALIDLLPTFDPPHLVWTHWKESAGVLAGRLAAEGYSTAHVYGDMTAREKDELIEEFKAGKFDVLVLSLGVGKFGHTLTNVRSVHWIDRTWNADDYFQALHRVKRIGLQHRPVSAVYRAPGTIDELVELNLEGKLGGISQLTRSELASLLKGLGHG